MIPKSQQTSISYLNLLVNLYQVRQATLSLFKGAEVMVCGSYRRGKATCGDVDVLITHPDGHSHELIFRPLLAHLRNTGEELRELSYSYSLKSYLISQQEMLN